MGKGTECIPQAALRMPKADHRWHQRADYLIRCASALSRVQRVTITGLTCLSGTLMGGANRNDYEALRKHKSGL